MDCTIRIAKTKALVSFAVTDLRLCFRICKNPVFSRRGSYANIMHHDLQYCLNIFMSQCFYSDLKTVIGIFSDQFI